MPDKKQLSTIKSPWAGCSWHWDNLSERALKTMTWHCYYGYISLIPITNIQRVSVTALNNRNIKGPRGSCLFCGVSMMEHPENGSLALGWELQEPRERNAMQLCYCTGTHLQAVSPVGWRPSYFFAFAQGLTQFLAFISIISIVKIRLINYEPFIRSDSLRSRY